MLVIPKNSTIYDACKICDRTIPSDFGGGSSLPKTMLMAFLVQSQQLSSFVEIGVYLRATDAANQLQIELEATYQKFLEQSLKE